MCSGSATDVSYGLTVPKNHILAMLSCTYFAHKILPKLILRLLRWPVDGRLMEGTATGTTEPG